MMSGSFKDRNNIEIKVGDECIWENKIGEKRKGIFKGLEGESGQQAAFLAYGEKKILYISITQLYRNPEK